MVSGISIPWIS